MNKEQVASILVEIGVLLELKGENPFKTRAYTNGARALESLDEPLEKVVAENRLGEIKGIQPMQRDPRQDLHSHHLYMFRFKAGQFGGGLTRDQFIKALTAELRAFAEMSGKPIKRDDKFSVSMAPARIASADIERQRACAVLRTKPCGSRSTPARVSFIAMSAWIWLVPS